MAKKSKRNRSEQRDVSITVARPAAVRSLVSRPLVSDRRLYHPVLPKPVYSPRRDQRGVVEAPKHVSQPNRNKARPARKRSPSYKMAFGVPRKVELCVRRQQRREVLFAMRRTGKGARAVRRRRNYWSGVSCR